MPKSFFNNAKKHLVNFMGWQTDRKIVVLESDDWGMIRMRSKEAFEYFLKKGYEVNRCIFNRYDALECNQDLEQLFDVLQSVRDSTGKPAIMTINNVTANPDFNKIRQSEFQNYYYEPFINTLNRYPGRENVMQLYRQGISAGLIQPQFHGREHLNVNRWMSELNNGNNVLHTAFDFEMFSVHKTGEISCRRDYLDAFGSLCSEMKWDSHHNIISSGMDLFERIWGFKSESFIAPCYIWPTELETDLRDKGVRYIQGTHVQRVPVAQSNKKIKKKYHYQGQKNMLGQQYMVRNVFFEPALDKDVKWADNALTEISLAFRARKPAIVSTHRVNYSGSIVRQNREQNLNQLKTLLGSIISLWPDVEFMSSSSLGSFMSEMN